jgi:putative FmdB family regulatory protein
VVSELFTNAVQHTDSGKPGGLVVVQVSRWLFGVRLAVTDQGSSRPPFICGPAAGELAENGNGLRMVSHLAESLDWHDDAVGRTISAVLGTYRPGPRQPAARAGAGAPARLPQPVGSGRPGPGRPGPHYTDFVPRYEYRCRACGDTFELTRPMSESSGPCSCPQGHDDTVKLLSTVSVGGRSSGSSDPSRPRGGGGGCCGGACGCG